MAGNRKVYSQKFHLKYLNGFRLVLCVSGTQKVVDRLTTDVPNI